MKFGPLPGTSPAVPILHAKNSHLFVHPNDVEPWENPVNDTATSALRFGVEFDLLGLTQNESMLLDGRAGFSDCLDPYITLSSLYYRTQDHNVHKVDLTNVALNGFEALVAGDYMNLHLKMKVAVSKRGVPTTIFGKLYHKLLDKLDRNEKTWITVVGRVNLQTGVCQVDALVPFDVRPVGFTLQAYRLDMNRKTAGFESCPFMNSTV
jgi:hypothetical protein